MSAEHTEEARQLEHQEPEAQQEDVGVGEPPAAEEPEEQEQLVWNGYLGQHVSMRPSELQSWQEDYEQQRLEAESNGTLGQFRFTPAPRLLSSQRFQRLILQPQMPQQPVSQLQPIQVTKPVWVDHYFIDEIFVPAQYAQVPSAPPVTLWSDNVTLESAMQSFIEKVNSRWSGVVDGTRWILRNAATTVNPQVFASWTKAPGVERPATSWPTP